MSITRKIAHNTIIQFSGKIISTIIGILVIAIMTRYLGQIGFGQYSTITAYLQIFGILIDLGLAVTVVRLISDPKYNQQTIFNNLFTLRFFSALIFFGLAPLIIIFFPYDNLVKLGVLIATLSFFLTALNQILIGLFQKELKMDKVTIAEISGRIILLVLVALFAYLNWGLLAIMWAVVFGTLINFILNYFFALKYIKIKFAFDLVIWQKIILTAWPIAISLVFNLIYFKADTLILSLVRSQAEVGIYNAPYRVLEILTNFIYMFAGLIFPILTTSWAAKNLAEFKNIFQKSFDFVVILSVPMVFGTMFIAEKLMTFIAGTDFAVSGLVLKIIIFATAAIFINSIFAYTIVVLNKQKQMVKVYVFVAILSLIGYLILIPKYGYYGAAAFTVLSETLILLFNFIVTIKTIRFIPSFMIFLKTSAAAIVMSLYLYLFPQHHILIAITISGLIYTFCLYLFKGFSKQFVLDIINFKAESKLPSKD